MNKYQHHLNCEAPICAGDPNINFKKEVLWYAGEKVCEMKPYTKFQKKQLDINKWFSKGKFKNTELAYNVHDLETRSI